MHRITSICVSFLSLAAPVAAGDFRLEQPIDCTLDDDCYIQQFVDHTPGPGALDFRCGTLSYDGHTGTDFALPFLTDMDRGVTVTAAAAGVVRGLRDGMPDQVVTDDNRDQLRERGCGNGVALQHPDGWETQYCHLKQGSIQVENGQHVAAGDALGQVGLSGNTQFPHLELVVRHNGTIIDPFSPRNLALHPGTTCPSPGPTLWETPIAYTPGGLIGAGFSDKIPDYDLIKSGSANQHALPRDAAALVLWGFAYGGQEGDILRLTIDGPSGPIASHDTELDKPKAQFFRATGKRLKTDAWPTGIYRGTVTMVRKDLVLDQLNIALTLP